MRRSGEYANERNKAHEAEPPSMPGARPLGAPRRQHQLRPEPWFARFVTQAAGSCAAFLYIVVLAGLGSLGHAQATGSPLPNRTLHYVVIDHSGSMSDPASYTDKSLDGGKDESLWDCLLFERDNDGTINRGADGKGDRDRGWLDECLSQKNVPTDGSADVYIHLFNDYPTGAQPPRAGKPASPSLLKDLGNWGADSMRDVATYLEPRTPDGSTALWGALEVALNHVRRVVGNYNRVTIYLFTDGKDNHSASGKNDKVLGLWRDLARKNDHVWLLELPIGSVKNDPPIKPEIAYPGSSIENVDPLNRHVRVERPETAKTVRVRVDLDPTSQTDLKCLDTTQSIRLRVELDGDGLTALERVKNDEQPTAELSFTSEGGSKIVVAPASLKLRAGLHELSLSAVDPLLAKNGVKGVLHCTIRPWLRSGKVQGEGGIQVNAPVEPLKWELSFPAKPNEVGGSTDHDKRGPILENVRPLVAARWPAGKSMQFGIDFDCPVDVALKWDFGDGTAIGTTKSGEHVWTKPGHYDVRVECVPTAGGAMAQSKTVKLEVFEVNFAITRPGAAVRVGDAVSFSAALIERAAPGNNVTIQSATWTVDGTTYEHHKDKDTRFDHVFTTPNAHEVRCTVQTPYGTWSDTETVSVAGQRLICLEPVTEGYAGTSSSFECTLYCGAAGDRIEWTVTGNGTAREGPFKTAVDNSGRSLLSLTIPEAWSGMAKIRASVVDAEGHSPGPKDVDEIDFAILPVGLYQAVIYPESAGQITVGEPKNYKVQFRGSRATEVQKIKWTIRKPQDSSRELNERTEAAISDFASSWSAVISEATARSCFGQDNKIEVQAIPIISGLPDEAHAVVWTETVRLPDTTYELTTSLLSQDGERLLEIGETLSVSVSPAKYVETMNVEWGDSYKPEALEKNGDLFTASHLYKYSDKGNPRPIKVTINRMDGKTLEVGAPKPVSHRSPTFLIKGPNSAPLSGDINLRIQPEADYAKLCKRVEWHRSFSDINGVTTGVDVLDYDGQVNCRPIAPGIEKWEATLHLKDGFGEAIKLGAISFPVEASDHVRGKLDIDWSDVPGPVKCTFIYTGNNNWTSLDLVVSRKYDGIDNSEPSETIKGLPGQTEFHYTVQKGAEGHYMFDLFAHRMPTRGNPNTRVLAANDHTKRYFESQWFQWLCIFLGTLGFALIWMWASLLRQAPRKWTLRAAWVPRVDQSARQDCDHQLKNDLRSGGAVLMPRWGWWQFTKHIEITTGGIATLAARGLGEDMMARFQHAMCNSGSKVTVGHEGLSAAAPWSAGPDTGNPGEQDTYVQRALVSTGDSLFDDSQVWDLHVWVSVRKHDENKRVLVFIVITVLVILANLLAGSMIFKVF